MPISSLPSLAVAVQGRRPNAKPAKRSTVKGRKDRAEAKVKQTVRAACVERDGGCALDRGAATDFSAGDVLGAGCYLNDCAGPSEWAHMHVKRRSQTRGQAPEVRHTTAASLMLCRLHHDEYDGRQRPRLFITALTRKGANGPLKFRRGK